MTKNGFSPSSLCQCWESGFWQMEGDARWLCAVCSSHTGSHQAAGPSSPPVSASRKIMGRLPASTGRWVKGCLFKQSHYSFINKTKDSNVFKISYSKGIVRVSNIIMRCRRPSTMQVNVVKVNTLSHYSICHSEASPQQPGTLSLNFI